MREGNNTYEFRRILLILVTVMWKVVSNHETRITFMPCKLRPDPGFLGTPRLYARLALFDLAVNETFNNCDPVVAFPHPSSAFPRR